MQAYIAPFPPSISSEPWAYGLALLADLLMSALMAAMLLGILLEGRRKRKSARLLKIPAKANPRFPLFSLVRVRLLIITGFLLAIVMRAVPDALWLLAWGEATKDTMEGLFLLDWWGDVLALIPGTVALALLVWSGQAIDQCLAERSHVPLARPKWEQARQYVLIFILVLVLGIGVTIGKASA